MKSYALQSIQLAILGSILVSTAGCKTNGTRAVIGMSDNDIYPYEGGKIDPYVRLVRLDTPGGTTGNSGILSVPINLFSSGNNGQACFPAANGWDKYYVSFYFLGPNVTPLPNPNNYPNLDNLPSVTVWTTEPANGSTLDTGIVIMDNLNPANKVCNDDASPPFVGNPKLSRVTFTPTVSGKKYRVGVFYKSGTVGPLSEIKLYWSYP